MAARPSRIDDFTVAEQRGGGPTTRSAHPADRRVILVTLDDAGVAAVHMRKPRDADQ
ncbi:hypothetical protein ABZ942_16790 [Nocardia sp. NPDC046473]|uniref:hypothetical protein n=1 Tax=Nocardia sp. NPDC046473 TaxID=3155733 RepID=UPI0033E02B98